ncbi:unnamed protein product [Linum tenue]|uniref:DUF676 domain-containing protein n=1 Tax=Linum tenue TaxID=586396 RepID=A0AAV0QSJ8_9ROSI|nr:unnamed protein product [Linum tenue]CAI0547896.1 unnamed protein product [Linum tenue]
MENGTAQNGTVHNAVCSSQSANGSCEVWSCNESDSSSADHLVIMVHGILGSSNDWKYAAERFVRNLPDKVFVHCSEKNMYRLTLDGVDVMGERLAQEVLEVIQKNPNLQKISFVAHSVGGLVARYAIGRLYRGPREDDAEEPNANPNKEQPRATIGGLEAVNFITVATPHLGSRGNKQLLVHFIQGNVLTCRSALRTFKRRVVYSNVGYDHIVGWRTSSIRRNNELPKWEDCLNEKYPHVVHEEHCKACDETDLAEPFSTDDKFDKIEEELVTGLSRVSWEKIDVSFHTSRLRLAAHSVIQVKDESMHIEGADVVQHLIDHFVL